MRPVKLRMKGFGAFREDTEVDFEDVELAALVGPTGSGKSTIIDGITFALFGTIARYDDARAVAPVISQLASEARVSLDFEIGGERYAAVRVVRRTPNGATTKEARLERGDDVLAGRASEMAPKVEGLLGLDFDRFTKTVVLPQGRFAQFLHDKASDRQELLRHLLDLTVYTRMGGEARQRAATATAQIAALEPELETDAPTPERIAELAATAAAARQAQTQLVALERELAEAVSELSAAEAEAKAVESLLEAASAANVPDAVRQLAGRIRQAHQALDEAEEEHSRKQVEALKARRLADEGPIAEVCQGLLEGRGRLVKLAEALEGLQVAEKEAKRDEAEAGVADERAAEKLDEASEVWERVTAIKNAEVLIAQLKEGEPCPVCHQTVVAVPDHDTDVELERARTARDQAAKTREATALARRDATGALIEAATRREQHIRQHADLEARLAGAPDEATLRADIDRAKDLAEARFTAEEAEAEALHRRDHARRESKALEDDERRARREFGRVRDRLASLEPPDLEDELLYDWETFETWATAQRTDLAKKKKSAQNRQRDAETRCRDISEQARRLCAPYFAPGDDPDRFSVQMAEVAREAEIAHAGAVAAREARTKLEERIKGLRRDEAVASQLGRLLRADGFERWLLEEAVADLVERANDRLLQLSNQQYSFVAEGTSFDIRDHHNADEVRGAKTLSGGETFLASLALALALSDSQAEMATEDSPVLGSLFLDEGFGTLDPDALAVVAAALHELGAAGRMVCIVTHIRELAEEMPVRFEVSKGPATSAVERMEV